MADPASIVLGVVALTLQAVQSSKALLKLGVDIKDAPTDIKAINKEVQSFEEVLSSLNDTLKNQEMQTAICGNKTLLEHVEKLATPINNCQAILRQLNVKLEKLHKSGLESRVRPSFKGVKWSLVSKNEISKLQQTLKAEKGTLIFAVSSIIMMTAMRVLTLTEENPVVPEAENPVMPEAENRVVSEARTRENSDASTIISPFAHVTCGNATLQLSAPRACDHSDLEQVVDDMEDTFISMNQILESLKAIVQSTQSAVMLVDPLLHWRVAQVYQGLSTQIQQLRSSTARLSEIGGRRMSAASNDNTRTSKFEDLCSRRNDLDNSDSAVIEVFFDCVSRFSSSGDSSQSIDELQGHFFGSPEYRFESLPSFYPEQYISEGSISEEMFAMAILSATDDPQTVRYFLNYAETARCWQRVVVFATFHSECQQTAALRVASSQEQMWAPAHALPPALHSLLRTMLPFIEFYSSITQIRLDLKMSDDGRITTASPRIKVIEDESEVSISDEREFLQYIDSVCIEQYVESNVITLSRINGISFKVYVDRQECCEVKARFTSSRAQGSNAFLEYLDEIRHLISLRRCANVSEFRGIVLDDTRRHLRSYLLELPKYTSLEYLLLVANSRSWTIPWPMRELWARQLIEAIVEIHSQGLNAGVFNLHSVGIRENGTVVFHRFQRSEKYLHKYRGQAPPEVRNRHQNDHPGSAVRVDLNFKTDIFQLGLALWLLMEHSPRDSGSFCARAACTHLLRTDCTADHSNPVELPECSENAPAYICNIIRDCRLTNPQSRVSTSELAHILCSMPQPDYPTAKIREALKPYSNSSSDLTICAYCDICGDGMPDINYHCNLCDSGDYDICQACYDKGHRCLDSEHRLVKRARSKYDFIDISHL